MMTASASPPLAPALTPPLRATDPISAASTDAGAVDTGEGFAAVFAAIAPGDGAPSPRHDSATDPQRDDDPPAPDTGPMPEALLALVAPPALPALVRIVEDARPLPTKSDVQPKGAGQAVAASVKKQMPQIPLPLPGTAQIQPHVVPLEGPEPVAGSPTVPASPPADEALRDILAPVGDRLSGRAARALLSPLPDLALLPLGSPVGEAAPDAPLERRVVAADAAPPPLMVQAGLSNAAPAAPTGPGGNASVMAQHLAGQLAAALPRLRQGGGEAVLTLDPARLGRVTLSWQSSDAGPAVLTVRAVEPATAVLLNQMGDRIATMLRAEPAAAGAGPVDLRLDIARAERTPDPRSTDARPMEANSLAQARDLASDTGASRQQHRSPASPDLRPQVLPRAAVNPDDPATEAAPRPARIDARARLA